MGQSSFNVDELTPRVRHFFWMWAVAQDRYVYVSKLERNDFRELNSDIDDWAFKEVLENARSAYDAAREAQIEAHPDAHLMLMMKVKGGWLARGRAQSKGSRIWKDNSERFEKEYEGFMKFYRERVDAVNE